MAWRGLLSCFAVDRPVLGAVMPRQSVPSHSRLPKLTEAFLACSIWTIDLAHLLRRFGMEVVFCTITLGANPAFSSEAFYAENMPEDEARVQQLFNVRHLPVTSCEYHRCQNYGCGDLWSYTMAGAQICCGGACGVYFVRILTSSCCYASSLLANILVHKMLLPSKRNE